ncbi:MAG: protein kinase [Pseudomonadota bacterium]
MTDESTKTFLCIYCNREHPMEEDYCEKADEPLYPVHKIANTTLENRYRVNRIIGEGGMGVIYECEHISIGKKLAVKFLNTASGTSSDSYKRFQREARATASIAHKNIVDIIDLGETQDGIPYIIMEYLQGEDLGVHLTTHRKLALAEARDILEQVLEALSAVHSSGVVHRDLKPENIFLARQSGGSQIVKILDFGISRLTGGDELKKTRLTKAGFVYGTPSYLSPEQARGRANTDHRADLWSSGTIFYEMITGHLPFAGENYGKLLTNILTQPPTDPRNFMPGLPDSVVEFIETSLEKDPNKRFQSAQEMIRDLKAIDIDYASRGSVPPLGRRRYTPLPEGRKLTPATEISASKHRDHTTPKQNKSSSYTMVAEDKKASIPPAGKRKQTPPRKDERPGGQAGNGGKRAGTPHGAGRKMDQGMSTMTPPSGSYRIVSPSSKDSFGRKKPRIIREGPGEEPAGEAGKKAVREPAEELAKQIAEASTSGKRPKAPEVKASKPERKKSSEPDAGEDEKGEEYLKRFKKKVRARTLPVKTEDR